MDRPFPAGNSQSLCRVSFGLESLSAAFLVDASEFFNLDSSMPAHDWPNLTELILTSQLLAPTAEEGEEEDNEEGIMSMLHAAGLAAMRMPKLQTMKIWNGDEKLAALFSYQFAERPHATITCTGTFNLTLKPAVIKTWEKVVARRGGLGLRVSYEMFFADDITTHADAIVRLGLWETVVRPVSLQQMLKEQRYVGELRSALDDEFIDPTESAYVDEVDSEDESMLDFE